jgi:hypothetical protein
VGHEWACIYAELWVGYWDAHHGCRNGGYGSPINRDRDSGSVINGRIIIYDNACESPTSP